MNPIFTDHGDPPVRVTCGYVDKNLTTSITELTLGQNNLVGSIPASIGNLLHDSFGVQWQPEGQVSIPRGRNTSSCTGPHLILTKVEVPCAGAIYPHRCCRSSRVLIRIKRSPRGNTIYLYLFYEINVELVGCQLASADLALGRQAELQAERAAPAGSDEISAVLGWCALGRALRLQRLPASPPVAPTNRDRPASLSFSTIVSVFQALLSPRIEVEHCVRKQRPHKTKNERHIPMAYYVAEEWDTTHSVGRSPRMGQWPHSFGLTATLDLR